MGATLRIGKTIFGTMLPDFSCRLQQREHHMHYVRQVVGEPENACLGVVLVGLIALVIGLALLVT